MTNPVPSPKGPHKPMRDHASAQLNIAVVEDNDLLRETMLEMLALSGHRAVGLDCAEALEDEAGHQPIDLLIADLNLPGEDGISLARRLRAAQPHVGIIMATARTELADRLDGYQSGADIYLTKPVDYNELLAAIGSLGRRLNRSPDTSGEEEALILDQGRLTGQGPAGTVKLSDTETALMALLARAPGQRLECWQLLQLLGQIGDTHAKANLEVRIVRLRGKLKQCGLEGSCIRAIRNWGYQLCVPCRIL